MLAVQVKCAKCVYTLLQHGADRDLMNVVGHTMAENEYTFSHVLPFVHFIT